jgi:hypothetical protein
MIKTLTILWITALSGPLDGDTYGIPYLSMETCMAAMKPVGDTLDHDYAMACETLPIEAELEP